MLVDAILALTGNYNSFDNTLDALNRMKSIYGGSSWHYTSPSGKEPDLHHGLLSRTLGGGRASLNAICDPRRGFGLSGDLSGNFVSMDSAVMWDIFVFMHELGRNFGSHHTHSAQYNPVVDTCGTSCPAQLPLAKSATIMSYCHGCR